LADVPGEDPAVVRVLSDDGAEVVVVEALRRPGVRSGRSEGRERVLDDVRPEARRHVGPEPRTMSCSDTPPKSRATSRQRLKRTGMTEIPWRSNVARPSSKLARNRSGARWKASFESHLRPVFHPGK
jgi:hypothetical protein